MYVPCLVISLQPDKACPALGSPALPALFPRPWKDTEPALYVPNTFGPSARRKQGNDSTETRGEGQLLIQAQATAHPSTLMQFPSQLLLQGCPRSGDTHIPPPGSTSTSQRVCCRPVPSMRRLSAPRPHAHKEIKPVNPKGNQS